MCVCVCVCFKHDQRQEVRSIFKTYFYSYNTFPTDNLIKDNKYDLFKTYFYSYNTFPTDNLLIVRPLKVLPCYLKVASG